MQKIKTVLKNWLIHSFIIWLLQNIAATVFAIYRSRNIITELRELNFDQPTIPIILFAIFLVELNNKYLFNKQLITFTIGSYLCGVITSLFIVFLLPFYSLELKILVNEPTLLIGFYAFTYPLIYNFIRQKVLSSQLLYEDSQAELNALKAQVNPHFLFNSLNSIYALSIQEKAGRTTEAIGELSDMMRHILEVQKEDLTEIEKEVEFLEQFIALQKLRLSEENKPGIQFRKTINSKGLKVPHLIFLPLLENAFKYGISSRNPIEIDLHLQTDENSMQFRIRNKIMNENTGMGTGLKNLKKRLDLIYGKNYVLKTSKEEGYFIVSLSINL